MKERIAAFLREEADRPLAAEEVAAALRLAEGQVPQVQAALDALAAEGLAVRTRQGRYAAPERMHLATGRLEVQPQGFATLEAEVRPPGLAGEIVVGAEALAGALHGDRVVVRLTPPAAAGGPVAGEVIRILARATDRVVGVFDGDRSGGYVTPDDPRLVADLVVPRGQAGGARAGEKVVCRITRWPDGRRPAVAQVVERLGPAGDPAVEATAIRRKYGLPDEFPPKLRRVEVAVPGAADLRRRTDLRGQTALVLAAPGQELDAAFAVESLPGGRWRLYVHVADVAAQVPAGSGVDREAYRRGQAVALIQGPVPLWPDPVLAACRLLPGADRLAITCEVEVDPRGQMGTPRVYPSLVRTALWPDASLAPGPSPVGAPGDPAPVEGPGPRAAGGGAVAGEGAAANPGGPAASPAAPVPNAAGVAATLAGIQAVARALRERRRRRGALDLYLAGEPPVEGDGLLPAAAVAAELRTAAGAAVAAYLAKLRVPGLFRVQPAPGPARAADLVAALAVLGCPVRPGQEALPPADLQRALAWAVGKPHAPAVAAAVVAALPPAAYAPAAGSHLTLALDAYTPFASPLQRYADVVVQRVLHAVWDHQGQPPARVVRRLERLVQEAATDLTARERVAHAAAQESVVLQQVLALRDRVGQVVPATVTAVRSGRLAVRLAGGVPATVSVSSLADDFYLFEPERYALVGQRTGRTIRPGDGLALQITGVDLAFRRVEVEVAPGWPAHHVPLVAPGPARAAPAPARAAASRPALAAARAQEAAQAGAAALARPAPAAPLAPEVGAAALADGRGAAPPTPAARQAPAAEAGGAAPAGRQAAPARRTEGQGRPTAGPTRPEAAAPSERPAAVPVPERSAAPEKAPAPQKPAAPARPAAQAPATAAPTPVAQPRRRTRAVDMWGVPIPAGRRRAADDEREDDEPPPLMFSLAAPPPAKSRSPRRTRRAVQPTAEPAGSAPGGPESPGGSGRPAPTGPQAAPSESARSASAGAPLAQAPRRPVAKGAQHPEAPAPEQAPPAPAPSAPDPAASPPPAVSGGDAGTPPAPPAPRRRRAGRQRRTGDRSGGGAQTGAGAAG